MGGIRPWFIDAGPGNNTGKDIQLFLSAPMNERVCALMIEADVSMKNEDAAPIAATSAPSVPEVMHYMDKLVSSFKLTVGGKTLWTLTGEQLFKLAMYKSKNVPTQRFIDIAGNPNTLAELVPGSAGLAAGVTAVCGRIQIPFYFNQPTAREPSLFAPGTAQLKDAVISWTRGDQTDVSASFDGQGVSFVFTNVRLLGSFAFERGYYVAPLAYIDRSNLNGINTPIAGGLIPNVFNTTQAAASATGEVKSYTTAYGEELHGILPKELASAFEENTHAIYTESGEFFVPYKFTPANAFASDFLPSPNGENLEITTAQPSEMILIERYAPTDEFIPYVRSKLGNVISSNSQFVMTGLPGQIQSSVPNELLPYMPKRLATRG